MYKEITIKKFRCFESLQLPELQRVNLIAGKNNTGKTAVLEAIYLLNGPAIPHSMEFLDFLGGFDRFRLEDPYTWEWLLPEKQECSCAEISGAYSLLEGGAGGGTVGGEPKEESRNVIIRLREREKVVVPDRARMTDVDSGRWELSLKYKVTRGITTETVEVTVLPPPATVEVARSEPEEIARFQVQWRPSLFLGTANFSQQNVRLFSDLKASRRDVFLIEPLRLIDQRVRSVDLIARNQHPQLHVDLGLASLVPVSQIGEGFGRLLSMLLAIANSAGGVVLIDEFENGLHYSTLKSVWKAVGRAAHDLDVQVFATTHSWECIQSAHHAFKENGPYQLRYHRLDQLDGRIVVRSLDEKMLERVQDTDLEIR